MHVTNSDFQMKHIHKYGASGPGASQEASITFQYSLKSAGKQVRELQQTAMRLLYSSLSQLGNSGYAAISVKGKGVTNV